MGYQDLMKERNYTYTNPQARINAKEVFIAGAGKGAFLDLLNIDFDKDRGFVWSGEVKVGGHLCTTSDENNYFRTWFHITIQKDAKPKVDDFIFSACGKGGDSYTGDVRFGECQNSVERGCYQDLQPLFEDYFWNFLRAAYNNALSAEQIVQQIEELALGGAVSSYLQGLIAAYNDSFLRNRGALEELSVSLGYHSSQQRYGICVSDENFQRAVSTQKCFLGMRLDNNLGFLAKNFVGDEEKCFLYKVDSLQKDFRRVLWEMGWRLATFSADYGPVSKPSGSKLLLKDFEKLYETLTDAFFTKEEKARIRTLEKEIYMGDKTARAAYDSLVGEIYGRYLPALDEIERVYGGLQRCGLGDKSMGRYLSYHPDPSNRAIQNIGMMAMEHWIGKARKNFENLGYGQKGLFAYAKKFAFERQIDRLLSVFTYVDKDGRERKMTVLDSCRQIILEKAESIEEMKDATFKKREYELLIKDVEALREFQYLIGVYCGNKAALLYGPEDAQRNALFGENSGYVSADGFFAKIEEVLSPRDGLGTEERIDLLIKTDYILEDIGRKISRDDFAFKLESVLGRMNGAAVDRGLGKALFGDKTAKEVFCAENGDIDLKKLAEARKSILYAIEEILDVPAGDRKASGEVKYTLNDSLIQAAKNDEGMKNALCEKLLVIDDQILVDKSDRGTAYQTADSSGSGSFGELSDFLSTDAYLDKLYAKINDGNTGYSDAGGSGAWNDGTVENRGDGQNPFKKILKIGLAVIVVLFILRACGGIF